MSQITAPFTAEQVGRLNRWQFLSSMHPYTCGGSRTDERHLDGEGVLMATPEGWKCPYCDYTQQFASERMVGELPRLEGSFVDRLWGEAAQHERLLATFRAESGRRGRFRGVILCVIAQARLPGMRPLLVEQLQAPDPWLRHWAARGLELLEASEGPTDG